MDALCCWMIYLTLNGHALVYHTSYNNSGEVRTLYQHSIHTAAEIESQPTPSPTHYLTLIECE